MILLRNGLCSCFRLLQTRLEKDELEDELKELKDKLSMMKQQTPDPKHTEILSQVQRLKCLKRGIFVSFV